MSNDIVVNALATYLQEPTKSHVIPKNIKNDLLDCRELSVGFLINAEKINGQCCTMINEHAESNKESTITRIFQKNTIFKNYFIISK